MFLLLSLIFVPWQFFFLQTFSASHASGPVARAVKNRFTDVIGHISLGTNILLPNRDSH